MSQNADSTAYAEIDFDEPSDSPDKAERTGGGTVSGSLSGTWVDDDDDGAGSIYDTSATGGSWGPTTVESPPDASSSRGQPPEPAGHGRASETDEPLAIQRSQQRVDQSFVKFVVSVVFVGVGIAAMALAGLTRTTPWIVAGAVLGPASIVVCRLTYKDWISNKRFNYRMLESLGEDTSGFEYEDKYRTAKVK